MNNDQLSKVEWALYSRMMLCKECADLCRMNSQECGAKHKQNATAYRNRSSNDLYHLNRVRAEKNKRKSYVSKKK